VRLIHKNIQYAVYKTEYTVIRLIPAAQSQMAQWINYNLTFDTIIQWQQTKLNLPYVHVQQIIYSCGVKYHNLVFYMYLKGESGNLKDIFFHLKLSGVYMYM
jgi:hypothetical protein